MPTPTPNPGSAEKLTSAPATQVEAPVDAPVDVAKAEELRKLEINAVTAEYEAKRAALLKQNAEERRTNIIDEESAENLLG